MWCFDRFMYNTKKTETESSYSPAAGETDRPNLVEIENNLNDRFSKKNGQNWIRSTDLIGSIENV